MTAHASLEYRSRSAGPTRRRCIWGAPTRHQFRAVPAARAGQKGARIPRAFSGQRSTRRTQGPGHRANRRTLPHKASGRRRRSVSRTR